MKNFFFTVIVSHFILVSGQNNEASILLHAKVYCTTKFQFELDENEKPLYFKPYGNPYGKFSWIYKPESRSKNEKCYVLVGYNDFDKEEIQKKAVFKILSNPLFTGTSTGSQVSSTETTQPTPESGQITQPQTPISGNANISSQTSPSQSSVTNGIPSSGPSTAPQTSAPASSVEPTQPTQKVITQTKPDRTQLLDLKIVCSNIPNKPTSLLHTKLLEGGQSIGNPFDLEKYKNCNFIATKYKDDIPEAEMKEIMENIYHAIKGPTEIMEY